MLYGWTFHIALLYLLCFKKVNIFMCGLWYNCLCMGCFIKIKITFHTNTLMKNNEMPIMDPLLVLIVELLYFMKLIVVHAWQCHKYSYVIPITSALSPHKIFISSYWPIPYGSHEKKTHFQMTWTSYFQCCLRIMEWHQLLLDFVLLCTFGPRNIHGSQLSKYLTNDMNLIKIFSDLFS